MKDIHIWGIKQNNLQNIDIKIPIGSMTVICGPSGSGKSSLAFETLFAEGQRRFIESMSNYARQFLNKAPKPDIEGVENIPPAISIEQKNSVKNSRSTVGTTTELVDYFRLLFEKIGHSHCPIHHVKTEKQSVSLATENILRDFENQRGYILVQISEEKRIQQGKKLHSQLLQDGFLRIWAPAEGKPAGEVIDISTPQGIKKGIPKTDFYLVIDRMAFQKEEKGRLADSILLAYEASQKYHIGIPTRFCSLVTTEGKWVNFSEDDSCPICSYTPPPLSSRLFSFNSPLGACTSCKGFGNVLELDEKKVIPNPTLSISEGALNPFTMPSAEADNKQLLSYCKKAKISITTPWEDLPKKQKEILWEGNDDFFGVKGLFKYLEEIKYKMHVRVFIARYRSPFLCPECKGSRLRSEALDVLIHGKNIQNFCEMTIGELLEQFNRIQFTKYEIEIAHELIKQVKSRLTFLNQVGVHYLTLNRETKTLSGGEYQRLMLANQLGMGLSQTLYVLDEPTVGLHPRDNDRLITILKNLKELGNTLVIVEHDHDVIANAEHVVEMGPGSGYLGGKIVFEGTKEDFFRNDQSKTVRFLKPQKIVGKSTANSRQVDLEKHKYKIELRGATGNNLKNVNLMIPLHRLVTITGVSGSGKSTLITKTLYPALARELKIEFLPSAPYEKIIGADYIRNVLLIDQSSIGRTARSSPVTYLKAFDAIREIMATLPESKARGYTPGTFSLNVDGGRCPVCKGTGFEEIDMQFMDNVIIPCDVCDGKKYRPEILEIKYKDKNIAEILRLTIEEALQFFVAHPQIRKPLWVLKEVGLEYLQLGQPASTLSGGESQRLKIAKELSQVNQKETLYILDEPTTGLHFQEVQLLMKVLHHLIEAGSSVIVVEHNQDVIRASDHIIDLGPEAGQGGGQIVAQGSPEQITQSKESLTGRYLKRYLDEMFLRS